MLLVLGSSAAQAQLPGGFIPPFSSTTSLGPGKKMVIPHPNAPPQGVTRVAAETQESFGSFNYLRVKASLETADTLLEADEIDYNSETGLAEARGHVHFLNYDGGEQLWADRADYDVNHETGTFYKVNGSAPGKMDPRVGVLTTGNPFLFSGDWAERMKDRYWLYRGTLTNCSYPGPWWTLTGPKFDIIPNDRALAYHSFFRIKGIPLLYTPVFYKSLSDNTRHSGFLTPNFGNSNRRGVMYGAGYYWAINRSYDLTYRAQYFTIRGFAHTADFRGKPTAKSDFNVYVYGVQDRGLPQNDGTRLKQGGFLVTATGKNDWGGGWYSRGTINYLSSFTFRQNFTESFNEAVFSDVNSIFVTEKDWSYYHINALFSQQETFQIVSTEDKISIRKLPQIEFNSRDQRIAKDVPIWVSWDTSAGLLRRTQPLYQTRQFVERLDAEPRVMTAFHWKDFHLAPYASVRETYYGSSLTQPAENSTAQSNQVVGQNVNRFSREVGAELIFPTLERVFNAPKWMGRKVKHSIEPRARFRYVGGIDDFARYIRFDSTDILANTTELEVSLANRLWTKQRDGQIRDFLSWEVSQTRYFNQNLSGAVVPGVRNVFQVSEDMTAYAFFDQPRNYSPVVSVVRGQPIQGLGLEWRTDYDPLRGKIVNNSFSADARIGGFFFSAGQNTVACIPVYQPSVAFSKDPCIGTPEPGTVLSPPSNQVRTMIGIGQENRRGWNAGILAIYDYRLGIMQYANTQITYNTSCCAYSVQFRRFAFGTRNENQYRFAFVIANIGSFGTLRRQERLF